MSVHKLEPSLHRFFSRFSRLPRPNGWLLGVVCLLLFAPIVQQWVEALLRLARDQDTLQNGVRHIGWWGPITLIGVNVRQIVVAPLPGYAVYLAAGVLYGPWWGGLWGAIGLLLGAMVAMTAGRSWGRPMVQRLIGEVNLKKWEYMMHSDSPMLWGILLFSPIGDVPFLLAGLACVRFRTIFVLTLITRVPIAFAAAAVGAEAFHLMWWQLMLIVVAFVLPLGFLYRYNLLKRGTNGLCFTNIGATA